MSDLVQAVGSKSALSVIVATSGFSSWWIEFGNPILDAASSAAGLILIIVLIRYHIKNTSAIKINDRRKAKRNNKK